MHAITEKILADLWPELVKIAAKTTASTRQTLAFYGGQGCGKTTVALVTALDYALEHPDELVLCLTPPPARRRELLQTSAVALLERGGYEAPRPSPKKARRESPLFAAPLLPENFRWTDTYLLGASVRDPLLAARMARSDGYASQADVSHVVAQRRAVGLVFVEDADEPLSGLQEAREWLAQRLGERSMGLRVPPGRILVTGSARSRVSPLERFLAYLEAVASEQTTVYRMNPLTCRPGQPSAASGDAAFFRVALDKKTNALRRILSGVGEVAVEADQQVVYVPKPYKPDFQRDGKAAVRAILGLAVGDVEG